LSRIGALLCFFAFLRCVLPVNRHCAGKRLLARLYEQGVGCEKSPEKAMALMRDLARYCRCADTLCQLAKLHRTGVLSAKEALELLEEAVQTNSVSAETWYEKGLLHRHGAKDDKRQ
jgi:TPR repeat protein